MRGVLIVVAAGLLTACSSTRYIQIETYNPGEVTFPEHVGQVLIVNNAVPQPKDTGYTYELFGEAQDACETKADSALFVACRELGEAIADASYFNDVLLYHDAIQKDRVMYKEAPLTKKQEEAKCEAKRANTVI